MKPRSPRLPLALLLALLAAACRSPPAPTAAADTEEGARAAVVERLERYYADFSARDWDRFAAHFAPGAVIATVWVPVEDAAPELLVQTVPEFVALAPQGPGSQPVFEERMTSADVTAANGLATARARYAARFGRPGAIQEWTGTDAFTLLRFEGQWRIVSLAFSGDGGGPE